MLEDVNDNRPNVLVNVLTESGKAEVRENVDEAGTFVAHLSAHDADSGHYGTVECQLDDGGASLFRLESLYDHIGAGYLSVQFLADRTIGRAFGTACRLSSVVCL